MARRSRIGRRSATGESAPVFLMATSRGLTTENPDRERVTATVEGLCRPFLFLQSALYLGCVSVSALSLLGGPIAVYFLRDPGFWGAVGSGLAYGIGITVVLALVTGFLDGRLTSWTADRFNRRFPIGDERDLAVSLLQQRQTEDGGVGAMGMSSLFEALNITPAVAGGEDGPVEDQVAEALETLAAERNEGATGGWAEARTETSPAPRPAEEKPVPCTAPGGVIPLQPEGADDRSRTTDRRADERPPGKDAP